MFLSNNKFSICIKLEIVFSNKITSTKPESFIIPNSSINILPSPILLLSVFYHPQFFLYQYFTIPDSSFINISSSPILLLSIFYHPQFFSYQYFIIPDSSLINILSSPILLLSIFYHPRFFSYQYFIIPDCSVWGVSYLDSGGLDGRMGRACSLVSKLFTDSDWSFDRDSATGGTAITHNGY